MRKYLMHTLPMRTEKENGSSFILTKDTQKIEESNLKISNIDWNPVENTVLANLQNEQICLALEQLTETQRKRVELFYLYGWTERQIAEYEGVNRYAVRKSLDQSIKKLKKFL